MEGVGEEDLDVYTWSARQLLDRLYPHEFDGLIVLRVGRSEYQCAQCAGIAGEVAISGPVVPDSLYDKPETSVKALAGSDKAMPALAGAGVVFVFVLLPSVSEFCPRQGGISNCRTYYRCASGGHQTVKQRSGDHPQEHTSGNPPLIHSLVVSQSGFNVGDSIAVHTASRPIGVLGSTCLLLSL